MFRILQHALNRAASAFHNCAETLLFNGRQTAGNIAWRRLAPAHIAADTLCPCLHVVDDLIDLISDLLVDCSAGKQMLAAEELGRFSEDDRCSKVYQMICHIADHAVAGHTARGIAGAALDRHDNLTHICFGTLHAGDLNDKLSGNIRTGLNCFGNTAEFLDMDDLYRLSGCLQFLVHAFMVGALAAERDNQNCPDIRTLAKGDQRFRDPIKIRRQLAASLMMQVDNGSLNFMGNRIRHIIGTCHRRNDGNIISGSHRPIRSAIAIPFHSFLPPFSQSPLPRMLSRLCTCTYSPFTISALAMPISSPYLMISSPL